MKKITKPGFLGIRIVFPKINEQKRIANILSTWDTAIDQTRKLISAKKKRAKAFMQQLLTGKKRLGSVGKLKRDEDKSQKHWKSVKLKELFAPIMRRNAECSKRVLTASGRHGLIAQDDYFNRSVAGQSLQKTSAFSARYRIVQS